ncbi:MAG: hypothetical protein WC787_04575 [Patescibacteria group bacterium]|jgi:DNA polymerase III delta subunit
MIIVCSGPDTYRAREKARELVAAFREKHDPNGLATDTVDGSEGLPVLLSRLAGGSLFAKKKLIRADGCLEKMKIADVRILVAKLETDKDASIVLTVEEEAPNAKTLEALKAAPLFHYPFELQTGTAFRTWVRTEAKRLQVADETADAIAVMAEGDAWLAIRELEKQGAHPHELSTTGVSSEATVFSIADAVLSERTKWRSELDNFVEDGAVSVALGQTRSYLEIRDGFGDTVHPYVARKLRSMILKNPNKRFATLIKTFIASRSGLTSGKEPQTLL